MHALWQFDQEGFQAINRGLHCMPLDLLGLVLSSSGLGLLQFLASLIFLRWEQTKRYVVPLLVTIPVSGWAFADLTKKLIDRDRPSNLALSIRQEEIFANSFPSGHTTTSFAIATLLVLMTWGTPHFRWARWSVPWAILVGLSRIYRGVHWPTDVIAGACFGTFSAALIYVLLGRRIQTKPSASV